MKTETLVAGTVVFAGVMGVIVFAASKAEAAAPRRPTPPRGGKGGTVHDLRAPQVKAAAARAAKPAARATRPAAAIQAHEVQVLPEHAAAPAKRTPRQAAQDLYDYATERVKAGARDQLGTPDHRNEIVHKAQIDMGGAEVNAALARGEGGIYGNHTRKRGKQLISKEFPLGPPQHTSTAHAAPAHAAPAARAPEPVPARRTIQAAPVVHSADRGPSPPPPPAPAPQRRSPRQAAEDLYVYATDRVNAGQRDQLGTPAQRNEIVHKAQIDMGGAALSAALARGEGGIYGEHTRERGKELTGKTFPAGPSQHAAASPAATPSGRTPKQAAQDLYDYATQLVRNGQRDQLGTSEHRNEIVHKAQIDMKGAKLAAALANGQGGIYGNLTRTRGKELLGREFPA